MDARGRTARLKAEPSVPIGTVPELVEVARRLAAEAVSLYRGLAERMADLGNERARAAFGIEPPGLGHARAQGAHQFFVVEISR